MSSSSSTTKKRSLLDTYTSALAGDDADQTPLAVTDTPTEPKRAKSIAVESFDRFYTENREKIKMAPENTYPRNEEAILEMQNALQTGVDRNLAELIAIGITHISFSAFYQRLCKNAYDAVALCRRQGRLIHLIVPGYLYKSNLWCTLLVWPIIRDHVMSISSAYNMPQRLGRKQKTLALIVDDALYSGSQMATNLNLAGAGAYRHNGAVEDAPVLFGVLVTATTKQSEERLSYISRYQLVQLVGHVIRINTISDIIKQPNSQLSLEQLSVASWYDLLEDTVEINEERTLAYFDHKMPDYLSTNGPFLVAAPLQGSGDRFVSVRSLIVNCQSPAKQTNQRFDISKAELQKFTTERTDDCPPAFYKSIVYTINGEPAIDVINRAPSGEAHITSIIDAYAGFSQ